MPRGVPKNPKIPKIGPQCPPLLRQLIEQEGTRLAVAKLVKAGSSTINSVATGKWPMTDGLKARLEAALKDHHPITTDKPTLAEVAIPPWNKKVATIKISKGKGNGKGMTLKKMPVELAELIKRHNNVLGNAAKAIGYSGWGPIKSAVESGAYEDRFHGLVYRALNGLPLGRGDIEPNIMDTFKTGLAIAIMGLSEFERLEEIAHVLGGHLVFKMSLGQNWIAIYSLANRGKLEQFKRLAHRDAKKIVCP